mgnify:CR=1 FL=1
MKYKFLRWLGAIRGPVPTKPAVFVIGGEGLFVALEEAGLRKAGCGCACPNRAATSSASVL